VIPHRRPLYAAERADGAVTSMVGCLVLDTLLLVTSNDEGPIPLSPLPGCTIDRSAAYQALLQDLLDLVGAESPDAEGPDVQPAWHHRARRLVGSIVTRHAEEAPEELFEPLIRAAVHEPDPSFNRQLVGPAIAVFGRRRVQLALIACLDAGTAPDIAGAARAWYWTEPTLTYRAGSDTPTTQSLAEYEAVGDLRERYQHLALRRFVTEADLDVRRCILPGLPLDQRLYPAELHELVTEAVRIARTSSDDYLRHRVEIQVFPEP
jgi:hypothetical protein